jgi:hypothetical protein
VDLSDLCSLAAVIPLALVLTYLLAILLRVACHFTGVEIPALGRAFFTAGATLALSSVVGYVVLALFIGLDVSQAPAIAIFFTLTLTLVGNLAIAVGLYRLLLGIRLGEALTLWRWQIMLFLGLALLLTCCAGVPLAVFGSV